jgi:methylenetetrahydrofolate reductase (NADPH)
MRFSKAYTPGRLGLSFELFPPKTPAGEDELFVHLAELMTFAPDYVTCTYGAGGSTREKTLEIITKVRAKYGCSVASHLTCVGSTVDELRAYLTLAQSSGVENIVALRGDPPKGETSFQPPPGGFRYAEELVKLMHAEFPQLGIAVAGYPETHQEATSPAADLENLRRKVAAGGEVVITQLFYDNADFYRFRDACDQLKIQAPIVPGILPVTNFAQIKRITALCGAKLPQAMLANLTAAGEDIAAQFAAGIAYATQQVDELLKAGVPGIHFYVLNKSPATTAVLTNLRLRR